MFMAKIQEVINNRHKYKVDTSYQRPADAWSKEDNQCLIDTILKGEPMPLFFLNYKSEEEVHYIVDGQQRLNAITKFYDNEITLNKKFSGNENHGKSFNGEYPINDDQRDAFLNYDIRFWIMEDYDDNRVRLIFSRLQRGKPLQLGERLNAKPGKIVERMREISNHPFMHGSIAVYKGRYGIYPDAARILFYEKRGVRQMGSNEIHKFFDDFENLDVDDRDFKNAISTLNYLVKCFPPDDGPYNYLEKHAWVLAVYTMVRELKIAYSLQGKEDDIRKFVTDFHNKVYNEDFRNSKINYQRFYDNVRGGWSEKIISLRRNILIQEFLEKFELDELDDRRQISDEEKISVFANNPFCEMCGEEFKDYKYPEYHHKKRYIDGGETQLDNIMVLCTECHKRVHGNDDFGLPTEEDIEDEE